MERLRVYDRIESMVRVCGVIAPHEISWDMKNRYGLHMTESALGRRMRELRELGRMGSRTRNGSSFKEFWVIEKEKK